jgi:hypothetical protein
LACMLVGNSANSARYGTNRFSIQAGTAVVPPGTYAIKSARKLYSTYLPRDLQIVALAGNTHELAVNISEDLVPCEFRIDTGNVPAMSSGMTVELSDGRRASLYGRGLSANRSVRLWHLPAGSIGMFKARSLGFSRWEAPFQVPTMVEGEAGPVVFLAHLEPIGR